MAGWINVWMDVWNQPLSDSIVLLRQKWFKNTNITYTTQLKQLPHYGNSENKEISWKHLLIKLKSSMYFSNNKTEMIKTFNSICVSKASCYNSVTSVKCETNRANQSLELSILSSTHKSSALSRLPILQWTICLV